MNPPICNPNDRVRAGERKADVNSHRLLVKKQTFAPHRVGRHVRQRKWQLHFVGEKMKVNAAYYVEKLLPKLVDLPLIPRDFIYQQDSAPAYAARHESQLDLLNSNCSDFITKDKFPLSSPNFNPLWFIVFRGQC